MKIKTIVFSMFFLFGTACIAQNKIDKAEFEHLMDYANCQYLIASIEKYDTSNSHNKDSLEKSVTHVLQKAKLDDLSNVPRFEIINDLISSFLTLLVLILLFFIFRKKIARSIECNMEKQITTVLENQRILSKNSSNELNKLYQNIRSLEKEFTNIVMQVKELQKKENNDIIQTGTKENVNNTHINSNNVKFFKSQNGKILTEELSNSTDSSFKVFNIKDNEAMFEYVGGVVNQDFFTDVCSFTNNPSDVPNKTKITTTTFGIVKKDSNNKWEVTEKAKIKFK